MASKQLAHAYWDYCLLRARVDNNVMLQDKISDILTHRHKAKISVARIYYESVLECKGITPKLNSAKIRSLALSKVIAILNNFDMDII